MKNDGDELRKKVGCVFLPSCFIFRIAFLCDEKKNFIQRTMEDAQEYND